MTYRGHVKQGVIVLDSPVQLPEGAEVEVRASEQISAATTSAEVEPQNDEALLSGSVAAVTGGASTRRFQRLGEVCQKRIFKKRI